MLDNEHLVRVLVGPVGSGKSMGSIIEIMRRSTQQTPYNEIRYTRWALIRNTLQQLKQTVLSDIQQYFGSIIHYFVSDSTIQIRLRLPDGTRIHSDWLLLPLDTKEDVRKLLSMQLTGAWINELREIPIEIIPRLIRRLGRYPSKEMGGPSWYGLIGDTNPWDTDSPYHDRLVLNPDPKWALYHQPSGVGPYAENVENLPPGYYETVSSEHDIDEYQVYVESQWGTSNAGQAVFRKSFHAPTHVKDMKLIVNPNRPLMVGLDFGRTPCALIGQIDNYGRAIIMKEVVTEGMGLLQMVDDHLKPVLMSEPFAGRRIFIVGDPAGRQRSQVTEETPFDVLKDEGLLAYPASTNNIDNRLLAVERLFTKQISGEPAIQINREGCPILIQSLGNKYRYRKKRDGQFEDTPEKLHPWSDICDALQYFCLGAQMGLVGRVLLRDRARSTDPKDRIPAAGWT
jgi:hypothetical protein